MEGMHMSTNWKKLKIGNRAHIMNPTRGINLSGTVIKKADYHGKGLCFRLDGGGQLFIPENGIKYWKFMKMPK